MIAILRCQRCKAWFQGQIPETIQALAVGKMEIAASIKAGMS